MNVTTHRVPHGPRVAAPPTSPEKALRDLVEKALARNMLVSEIMQRYHLSYDFVHEVQTDLALIDYKKKQALKRKMM